MRLYLSSYGLGNKPERLTLLVGKNRRALVSCNAMDFLPKAERIPTYSSTAKTLNEIGFHTTELDLRDYFQKERELEKALQNTDLIWVRGGNAFVLRRAMKQSGFEKCIRTLLNRDACVYGGFSAGVVVMGKTLRGIELVDDPTVVPQRYDPSIIWDGLGVIDFSIAPHFQSEHPESESINRVVEYFERHQILYKALRDGEVVVVQGDHIEVL